jgi:aryl-alcohol dehydrogenase-like predicted oxidoreductase
MSSAQDFVYKDVPAMKKRLHRLGLAPGYGLDEAGIRRALERGMNYLYFMGLNPMAVRRSLPAFKDALTRDRERYVVAAGPTLGYFGGSVRRSAERALKSLGTDYIDIFQLNWLGVTSSWTDATVGELVKLKDEGKVKALGISIHDRERAGKLAASSPLDVFMIRYNAAHPGAEKDIFPHLAARKPAVVAYTATSWRKLLKRPSGWEGKVATAADCYRFCLSSPHVDVVLTGPASQRELDENLAGLEKGPMSEEEMRWMRDFGRVVHG